MPRNSEHVFRWKVKFETAAILFRFLHPNDFLLVHGVVTNGSRWSKVVYLYSQKRPKMILKGQKYILKRTKMI